ncbi:hypothetical protein diail_7394, partial [Diaporthe ilicicola]
LIIPKFPFNNHSSKCNCPPSLGSSPPSWPGRHSLRQPRKPARVSSRGLICCSLSNFSLCTHANILCAATDGKACTGFVSDFRQDGVCKGGSCNINIPPNELDIVASADCA